MDEPHRVIFLNNRNTISTRVFSSEWQAKQFALNLKTGEEVLKIHPAKENPDLKAYGFVSRKVNFNNFVQTNECKCGRKKKTAYEKCVHCSGILLVNKHHKYLNNQ
jgi:hypothetical protein